MEKTYDGQTAAFLAAVATCMPRRMDSEVMQGWITNPDALKKALASLLCPPMMKEEFDPNEFFQNREGLWRSDAFAERVLSVATERIQLPDHIPSFTLPKSMGDSEIRRELGDNHVFGASECCMVIASMISRQPNGEDGDLINDGKANILYVRGKDDEVFTVDVRWYADARKWRVRACQFDDHQWHAGNRGFSRNSIFGS